MKKLLFIFFLSVIFLPRISKANLTIDDLVSHTEGNLNAQSYMVIDQVTGETLMQKNADKVWVPASLTKIVSSLVVLDQNPDLRTVCTISPEDEVGGARLNATRNGKYYLGDLLDAALVASANNATSAMADCVLDRASFVAAMNKKATELGAKNTIFYEPSGMDPKNHTTAEDQAAITRAAFSTLKIQEITQKKSIYFASVSKPKRIHNLKTTNQLLGEKGNTVIAAKTGYLDESLYNFAYASKVGDRYLISIVLGSPTKSKSFEEAKNLTNMVSQKLALILNPLLTFK